MNGESNCFVINYDDDDDDDVETHKDSYKLIASFKGFLTELPVIVFYSGR